MEKKDFEKVVLVTGGMGFIGSHIIKHLVKNYPNWLIVNIDAITYAGVKENLEDIENEVNYRFELGDVSDFDLVTEIFKKYDITDVIHLAASSHVDRSLSAPMEFLKSNTVGTVTLLEVARSHWETEKGHRFYYFSTDEVFGYLNIGEEPFNEENKLKPSSPYSASKAAGDLFVKAYHTTYGMETLISHCSNAIGPRQLPEKLVPATIQRVLNGEPIVVYDKGLQRREWIYTDDIVSAAMCVFEKGVPGEAYNIGSGNECANIDLVNMIIETLWMRKGIDRDEVRSRIKYVENARPGHDFRYAINNSKIISELGWEGAQNDMVDCVKKTVDWYLENQEWVKNLKNRK